MTIANFFAGITTPWKMNLLGFLPCSAEGKRDGDFFSGVVNSIGEVIEDNKWLKIQVWSPLWVSLHLSVFYSPLLCDMEFYNKKCPLFNFFLLAVHSTNLRMSDPLPIYQISSMVQKCSRMARNKQVVHRAFNFITVTSSNFDTNNVFRKS